MAANNQPSSYRRVISYFKQPSTSNISSGAVHTSQRQRKKQQPFSTSSSSSSFYSNVFSSKSSASLEEDRDLEVIRQIAEDSIELVFFPSYAKFNSRKHELLINVHGWVFSPKSAGKPSRKNKYTMLLARSIAGLPALPTQERTKTAALSEEPPPNLLSLGPEFFTSAAKILSREQQALVESEDLAPSPMSTPSSSHSDMVAYPFPPSSAKKGAADRALEETVALASKDNPWGSSRKSYVGSFSTPPSRRTSIKGRSGGKEGHSNKSLRYFSDIDLVTCHANLARRIAPFLSRPVASKRVTVQVMTRRQGWREDQIEETLDLGTEEFSTNEFGHFKGRMRILDDRLNASNVHRIELRVVDGTKAESQVQVVAEHGISIISDIDDTVKHTAVTAGIRETFRNAFVRELPGLEIRGVRRWYSRMEEMGVRLHYVSNSPWQLWPVIQEFMRVSRLPSGSVHLKQYSGVLQGIWEPAAEKKRANVEKVLLDFPSRKFILVGDSGEQDLELYTELAMQYRKQVVGVFIRDVSTGDPFLSSTPITGLYDTDQTHQSAQPPPSTAPSNNALAAPFVAVPPSLPSRPPVTPERKVSAENDVVDPEKTPTSGSHRLPKIKACSPVVPEKPLRFRLGQTDKADNNVGYKSLELPPRFDVMTKSRLAASITPSRPSFTTSLTYSNPSNASASQASASPVTVPRSSRPTMQRSLSATSFGSSSSSSSSTSTTNNTPDRRTLEANKRLEAWQKRLDRSISVIPPDIKLHIWKNGEDAQHLAEALVRLHE